MNGQHSSSNGHASSDATPVNVLRLRYMTQYDIPQVIKIDEDAFSNPWSARSYAYEIGESSHSHMLVIELARRADSEVIPPPSDENTNGHHSQNGFQRFFQRWHRGVREPGVSRFGRLTNPFYPTPTPPRKIVAYGGLWRIVEEAHISTIASHINFRGRGYGELALVSMVRRGFTLGADYIALEVRMSNFVAQNLYHKHGFRVFAIKNRYYRDNGEDAYDMRLHYTRAVRAQLEASYMALRRRHVFIDQYSDKVRQP